MSIHTIVFAKTRLWWQRILSHYEVFLCNTRNEMDNNLNYDLGWSCNNSYKRTNNGIDITHYKDDGYSILCFVEICSLITQTRIFNFKRVSM